MYFHKSIIKVDMLLIKKIASKEIRKANIKQYEPTFVLLFLYPLPLYIFWKGCTHLGK